jgi:hypothetical protein
MGAYQQLVFSERVWKLGWRLKSRLVSFRLAVCLQQMLIEIHQVRL